MPNQIIFSVFQKSQVLFQIIIQPIQNGRDSPKKSMNNLVHLIFMSKLHHCASHLELSIAEPNKAED